MGFDADLVIWDSEVMTKLSDDMVVDGSGYNPYSGRIIKGWPEMVFLRGSVIVSNNQVIAKPGNGNFLPTKLSPNVKPKGVVASDLLKQNNYGAILQS
ncbi:MAG: dihydropyrimidinase [Alphaproteobacteria bacterium]